MNNRYDRPSRFTAAGLAAGSILALIVAMAISVVYDIEPTEADAGATAVSSTGPARA